MENQIDSFLTQLMQNMNDSMNIQPNRTNNTRNYTTNSTTNNSNPMRYINRQLDTISNLIVLYNYNHLEYQRNINTLMSLLQLNQQSYRTRVNLNNTTNTSRASNIQNPSANTRRQYVWRSYNQSPQPTNIWNGARNSNLFNDEWANILNSYLNQVEQERRLTNTEITEATRTFTYNENMNDTLSDNRCPISLETFVNGDILSEVRGCGHIFRRDNLLRWLSRSNCCPICRFNMLTGTPAPTSPGPTSPINNTVPDNSNNTVLDNSNNTVLDNSNNNPQGFVYSFSTNFPQDNSLNTIMNQEFVNLYNQAFSNNSFTEDVSNNDIPDNVSVD
tara:strand:- start:14908 stop:15903 length:996 start_codon:yes stop_codon:yes gene_type:complete